MNEIFKELEGYNGTYQVSNLGNIKSVDRLVNGPCNSKIFRNGVMLKKNINKDGNIYCQINTSGKNNTLPIHRIVAIHFIKNPYNFKYVKHKDGDKNNNIESNLYWSEFQK